MQLFSFNGSYTGLVRTGVAPDHPEVKSVINDFSAVAEMPEAQYFGNVDVGAGISLEQLQQLFDVVVLSYGASVCCDHALLDFTVTLHRVTSDSTYQAPI